LKIMITPTKALLAALATGAMAVSTAVPAMAQDGFGHGQGRDWNSGGNPRHAISACSRIAERSANRHGYGRANVSDIRDVRNTRWGYVVRGRIDVRSFRDGRDGWRDGHRGWNGYGRGHDSGSFVCRFERGRVVAFDINGIRGL
jgi:hypothetical protein